MKKEEQRFDLSCSVTVLGAYSCILCFLAMNLMLVASQTRKMNLYQTANTKQISVQPSQMLSPLLMLLLIEIHAYAVHALLEDL